MASFGNTVSWIAAHLGVVLGLVGVGDGDSVATEERTKRQHYPHTDSGNAELFAALFGDDVRFDHKRERWLLRQCILLSPDPQAVARV